MSAWWPNLITLSYRVKGLRDRLPVGARFWTPSPPLHGSALRSHGGPFLSIIPFPSASTNSDAIALIEGTLERLRSGETVAVAVVEVLADGAVVTHYSESEYYHQLNSGAARLAARLALD